VGEKEPHNIPSFWCAKYKKVCMKVPLLPFKTLSSGFLVFLTKRNTKGAASLCTHKISKGDHHVSSNPEMINEAQTFTRKAVECWLGQHSIECLNMTTEQAHPILQFNISLSPTALITHYAKNPVVTSLKICLNRISSSSNNVSLLKPLTYPVPDESIPHHYITSLTPVLIQRFYLQLVTPNTLPTSWRLKNYVCIAPIPSSCYMSQQSHAP
jgi:hypothetical protein